MGSSISPIIANIVMQDLGKENLTFDFVIPWYFRYVDSFKQV